MEKIVLKNISTTRNVGAYASTDSACTCIQCGYCLLCIIFAPFVSIALLPGLGVQLEVTQKGL